MNAKQYLQQYQTMQAKVEMIDAMIKAIRSELSGLDDVSISSPWPDGQGHGSGIGDPTGNNAARAADNQTEAEREKLRGQLADLELEALRKRSEMWAKRLEIAETIGQVQGYTLNRLLQMRYIEDKSFELIAVELHYTYRHIINLHGIALEEVCKLINNVPEK